MLKIKLSTALILVLSLALALPAYAKAKKSKSAKATKFVITLATGGKVEGELYPDLAPITVDNFAKLAGKHFYDGLSFHRVEPGFVVQGGDPAGNGSGGPGYTIKGEFTTKKNHIRGTLAMARTPDPDSAGSQFYICLAPAQFLDGKYAIFGQVTKGMELVDQIKVGDKMSKVEVK
jgi:peptidylprolyl isomerase/peptidyl-prolyl cis-trans isomerase B (cyclophilin B)